MPRSTRICPSSGSSLAGDQAEQRGLARAVGAHQAGLLAALKRRRGLDEEELVAVLLADGVETDHGASSPWSTCPPTRRRVTLAGDGVGRRCRRSPRPRRDIVLLDLEMPRLDGFEVLGRLRADPATCELPVIVVTGREGRGPPSTGRSRPGRPPSWSSRSIGGCSATRSATCCAPGGGDVVQRNAGSGRFAARGRAAAGARGRGACAPCARRPSPNCGARRAATPLCWRRTMEPACQGRRSA